MPFDTYWKKLATARPELENHCPGGVMKMKVPAFKQAISRAYAAGQTDTAEMQKAAKAFEEAAGENPEKPAFSVDAFAEMFGKTPKI